MSANDVTPNKPEWLDDNFLQMCISGDGLNSSNYQINNVQLKYAVPKGDNYGSVMMRLIINEKKDENVANQNNFNNNEKRYILKVAHADGEFKEAFENLDPFNKEVDMYTNAAPTLHKLLEASGITSRFACRCLHVQEKPDVIVLEDLIPLGYKLADMSKGLDLHHCQLLYSKYAILHGASMRHIEMHSLDSLKPFYIKPLLHDVRDNDPFQGPETNKKMVEEFADDLLVRDGYEKEAKYLKSISDKFFDMAKEVCKFNKGDMFNALLHGDCWINNMMFKYDEAGKGVDVLLLDLQMSNYNTILHDFIYSLVADWSTQVLKHHFNDLIHYYIENLRSTLLKLGYKGTIPTVEQFREELRSKSILFVFYAALALPIVLNILTEEEKSRDKDEVVSLDQLNKLAAASRRKPVYQNQIHAIVDLLRREQMFF